MSLPLLLAQSTPMAEKLSYLGPEITLFVATVIVLVVGSSASAGRRSLCAGVSFLALAIAGVLGLFTPEMPGAPLPGLMNFAKPLIAAAGALLVLLVVGTVDREFEPASRGGSGLPFSSLRSNRGEFFAFFLFSLTGLMLCTTADDLIWLFLALELTSLPTYVLVAISTRRSASQEAGVKYFFLGAFGAAIFLYGFALLYGAAGTTVIFAPEGHTSITTVLRPLFSGTTESLEAGGGGLALLGLILAIVGVSFKIAAVPMHFYTPDVYQGAATPIAAFLAFVPKTAGFVALILILSTVGWDAGLPDPIRVTLWIMAALTMTVGNVLAWLQTSVKRMLAYSSIAHSGYMIVGLIAGPGAPGSSAASNGLAAVLFYLLCYAFMNLGAFAVLACLERERRTNAKGQVGGEEEVDSFDDLRGLCSTHPLLGWTMVLCAASLIGFPPLLGFFGKFYLFTAAISAGEIALVVVLGINSAIAAFYYLRLVSVPLLEEPTDQSRALTRTPYPTRVIAAALSAASVIVLVPFISSLMTASDEASRARVAEPESRVPDPDAVRRHIQELMGPDSDGLFRGATVELASEE